MIGKAKTQIIKNKIIEEAEKDPDYRKALIKTLLQDPETIYFIIKFIFKNEKTRQKFKAEILDLMDDTEDEKRGKEDETE